MVNIMETTDWYYHFLGMDFFKTDVIVWGTFGAVVLFMLVVIPLLPQRVKDFIILLIAFRALTK